MCAGGRALAIDIYIIYIYRAYLPFMVTRCGKVYGRLLTWWNCIGLSSWVSDFAWVGPMDGGKTVKKK